ncbi:hypothetical protein [Pseudoalteromonas gelatinilytica]|uniref:hypothetical protein n=1 Tax=Pseudoalteromonas gelatinilytica TaxID=1703256 RepID=UPI0007C50190|nr:hypothetical protein [Pseudoalteromonas gelatinilytica]
MVDYELMKSYDISDTESVTIVIDEDVPSIIVFTEDEQRIGNIDLSEVDEGFYIVWMYLDQLSNKYKKKGIGRACLEFFSESYQMPIYAAKNDGHPREDGSHLTGDAPGFISRMRSEGLVV